MPKKQRPRAMPTDEGDAEPAEMLIEGTETTVIAVVLTPQELDMVQELADAQEVDPAYLLRQWVLEKIYTS